MKYALFAGLKSGARGIFASVSSRVKWSLTCACVSVDFAGGPCHRRRTSTGHSSGRASDQCAILDSKVQFKKLNIA